MKKKLLMKKYNILIIVGMFFVLYNPPLFIFNTARIVGLLSIIYIIVNNRTKVSREVFQWIKYFVILLTYLAITAALIHGGYSNGLLYPIYYLLNIIPFAWSISIYRNKNQLQNEDLIGMILVAALFQALLAVAAFASPSIQEVFIRRIISNNSETLSYWATLRMYGFSNGLFFEMPVIQSILAVIALYLASHKDKRYYFASILLFFSAIINARISIIVVLIGIIVMVFLSRQGTKKKVESLFGVVIALVLILNVGLPFIKTNSPSTYNWITDGMEEISGIIRRDNTKGYYSYYTSEEKTRLPDSTVGLLFGEGTNVIGGKNSFGVSSDIGYVNDIWKGGLFYLIIEYSMYFTIMIRLAKTKDSFSSFIGILIIILTVVLNIKGLVFTSNGIMNLVVIMNILLQRNDASVKIIDETNKKQVESNV